MTIAHPPRLASWLLSRLASASDAEALSGDLFEKYQRQQSAAWYWWQAVSAIAAGAVRDVRERYVLAVAAIGMWFVLTWLAAFAAQAVYSSLGLWLWNWTVAHEWDALRVFWFGQPRTPQPPLLLMACVNAATIGWIMARLYRERIAAILFCCLAFSTLYLLMSAWGGRQLWPVAFGAWPPFIPRVAYLVGFVGAPICFLAGAVLGSKPPVSQRALH
jgi:hypothetical protein